MPEDPPDRLEIYINEQRADLELFRLIIQICLIQLLDTFPPGAAPAYLNDFENEIVTTLQTHSMRSQEPRFLELMKARAESFFHMIRAKKGYPARNTGAGQAKN
jgi:hypothetical protein